MLALSFSVGSRSVVLLAAGACFLGCGGSEFTSASDGNSGGAAGSGAQGGNAGSVAIADASASDTGSNGSGGASQSRDGAAGAGGTMGVGGSACPPCAAPPNSACVGQGPCGCGPYICPEAGVDAGKDAGKDAAAEAGPRCGETAMCPVGRVCCNPLKGICTLPGMTCIQ